MTTLGEALSQLIEAAVIQNRGPQGPDYGGLRSGRTRIRSRSARASAHGRPRTKPQDPLSPHEIEVIQELVSEAVRNLGDDVQFHPPKRFSGGNTAMLVASIELDTQIAVKVDDNRKVIREAELVKKIKSDLTLPDDIRHAFPQVFAISGSSDSRELFGYVMEFLPHKPLSDSIADPRRHKLAADVITQLWQELLGPTYGLTRTLRVPNLEHDYFGRVRTRLDALANSVQRPTWFPEASEPFEIRLSRAGQSEGVKVPTGWGPMLSKGVDRLREVNPPWGTFVHGDPNPENIMFERSGKKAAFEIRLIDPKDWWHGDYVFDVAKIGHYLRVTSPVETRKKGGVSGSLVIRTEKVSASGIPTSSSDLQYLGSNDDLETNLLDLVERFAEKESPEWKSDPNWKARYQLAVASNLLGIVGPRAEKGNDVQDWLAEVAFAEGIRILNKVIQ